MKKILTIATFITLFLLTLNLEAQIYRSGGIGGHGSRTSYGSRSGGGGSGESKIFLGGSAIFRNTLTPATVLEEESTTLKIAVKYYLGATVGKSLLTANFEIALSGASAASSAGTTAAISTRYYAEAAYPILGTFDGRFAIAGYIGAGANSLEAGESFDHDKDEYVSNDQETALYAPIGAYINLNVLDYYGIRIGYQFAYNTSDFAEKAFSAEGFMFGSYFRF